MGFTGRIKLYSTYRQKWSSSNRKFEVCVGKERERTGKRIKKQLKLGIKEKRIRECKGKKSKQIQFKGNWQNRKEMGFKRREMHDKGREEK